MHTEIKYFCESKQSQCQMFSHICDKKKNIFFILILSLTWVQCFFKFSLVWKYQIYYSAGVLVANKKEEMSLGNLSFQTMYYMYMYGVISNESRTPQRRWKNFLQLHTFTTLLIFEE